MKEFFGLSKRAEKILGSTLESASSRIEAFAAKEGYTAAFRDGAPDGVLQFYLLHKNFEIADTEAHVVFLNQLRILDTILNEENTRVVEESGYEAYIEVEPRKEIH